LDPPTTQWIKDLLLDLKGVVEKLRRERGHAVVDEGREEHYQQVEQANLSMQRQMANMETQLATKAIELKKKEEEVLMRNEKLLKKDQQLWNKDQELLKKDQELWNKDQELLKKDQELWNKDQELLKKEKELQAMKKELEALKVKMKNGCTPFCVFVSVFVVGMFVAMLFTGIMLI
jgi:uncharacterized protein (DUF3084 family)